MIKKSITIFTLLICGFARAEFTCDLIPGQQNHAPVVTKNGSVCFIEQPILEKDGKPSGAEEVAVYFIPRGHSPVKAEGRGLINDGDGPGKIDDAFMLDVDHDGNDEIVVIQCVEPRTSEAKRSGKFCSVYVFNYKDMSLHLNERASEWFGYNYSWLSDDHKIIYKFPYLTQDAIRQALNSPFATLIIRAEVIPVIVKQKNYLHYYSDGDSQSKKYLIAGDKATVDKYTAGWCRVNYSGGKEPLQMWMMCDALEVDKGKQ